MITTDAWVLHEGPGTAVDARPPRAVLSRENFSFPEPEADEVLIEPLFGSWEANIEHALSRQPIDVCRQRGESPVVPGNGAVVRVLRAGDATGRREGDICIIMPFGQRDRLGYAKLIYAFDAPGTVGVLAKRSKLAGEMLLPLPENTAHPLPQWATYGRYFTAWDNWEIARGCWLTQNRDCDPADGLVFAWGGGTAFAELQLARRDGFRTAMTASSDWRLDTLARHGITPVDRRLFPDLHFSEQDARRDPDYLRRYRAAEETFLAIIDDLSGGHGVAIFVDNIGAPLYRATVKALGRRGVLATEGWKHGMRTTAGEPAIAYNGTCTSIPMSGAMTTAADPGAAGEHALGPRGRPAGSVRV